MIIGITGLARCGKDTFCKYARQHLKSLNYESQRLAFADELKKDLDAFQKEDQAMYDRLILNDQKIDGMISSENSQAEIEQSRTIQKIISTAQKSISQCIEIDMWIGIGRIKNYSSGTGSIFVI